MKIILLGTGTSCGVPQIGCDCPTCTSTDPRDKRLRCSALVQVGGKRILIDCGPDFREQMLRIDFMPLDAVLITHEHYDHVGGLDDLRPYSIFGDVDVYAEPLCADHLMQRIPYCFTPKEKRYPGVPAINLHPIRPHEPILLRRHERTLMDERYLDACVLEKRTRILSGLSASEGQDTDVEIMPIRVMHGNLPIVGFRIADFAYITDMKTIPDSEIPYLQGLHTLVLNALRHETHHTHQTIEEAIRFARSLGSPETYLIHMSHHIQPHALEDPLLPPGFHLAYDFMEIDC